MNKGEQDAQSPPVTISFFLPSPKLIPYISLYYCMDVTGSHDELVEDYLHPEWANLRIIRHGHIQAALKGETLQRTPSCVLTGPTSCATRFLAGPGRYWGIGVLPAGWARFMDGWACDHADHLVNAANDPVCALFAPLSGAIHNAGDDKGQELRAIEAHMEQILMATVPGDDAAIDLICAALLSDEITTAAQLADLAGISLRSLERFCNRVYGFPPKLLIRRQRFLRSLASFMQDPSMKWLNAMDYQYYDQAHFIRDFVKFMDMTPSAYAALPHPILSVAMRDRARIAGDPVQGLHSMPTEQ